jgi:hypothetical protein
VGLGPGCGPRAALSITPVKRPDESPGAFEACVRALSPVDWPSRIAGVIHNQKVASGAIAITRSKRRGRTLSLLRESAC